MTSLPPLLATDSEREDTVEMLRAAFAEGCFDSDELWNGPTALMPPRRGMNFGR